MTWEAVTALSTAFTGLVILLTVIFAARQVRALNEQSKAMSAQIDHLRRATQLDGTLAIFDEVMAPDIIDAYHFVMNDLEERMKDDGFKAEAFKRAPDLKVHKELPIMRHFERIGTLVKNGLVDSDAMLDFMGFFVLENWQRLKPIALGQRQRYGNERLWENFEYLARLAERFSAGGAPSAQKNPTDVSP
jgi:hypothetical protein